MIAAARAVESERPDRLFCDPFAAVLAGVLPLIASEGDGFVQTTVTFFLQHMLIRS
jgi:O-methyltransferase involved in polyketide biosynthesis